MSKLANKEGFDYNDSAYDMADQDSYDVNSDSHMATTPKGIKKENSMMGVLERTNPAYPQVKKFAK